MLSTILFTDIVGSTELAARLGDRAWRQLLERHDELIRRELARFRGREVDTAGDGFLASFDGPGRAVSCARAAVEGARTLGLEIQEPGVSHLRPTRRRRLGVPGAAARPHQVPLRLRRRDLRQGPRRCPGSDGCPAPAGSRRVAPARSASRRPEGLHGGGSGSTSRPRPPPFPTAAPPGRSSPASARSASRRACSNACLSQARCSWTRRGSTCTVSSDAATAATVGGSAGGRGPRASGCRTCAVPTIGLIRGRCRPLRAARRRGEVVRRALRPERCRRFRCPGGPQYLRTEQVSALRQGEQDMLGAEPAVPSPAGFAQRGVDDRPGVGVAAIGHPSPPAPAAHVMLLVDRLPSDAQRLGDGPMARWRSGRRTGPAGTEAPAGPDPLGR